MSLGFEKYLKQFDEYGQVMRSAESVVWVQGLPKVELEEMVVFESEQIGYVMGMNEFEVEVAVVTDGALEVGDRVARTGAKLGIEIGDKLLGRTVGPLGLGWTKENDELKLSQLVPIEKSPQGITSRKRIQTQFETGIALVDMLVPIGRGQRELVLGDRKTGKSFLLWHALANEVKSGGVAVLALIGKRRTEIVRSEQILKELGIADRVVVVAASSDEMPGAVFLVPYTAMTIAEFFRDKGIDSVVVMDDMSTHANYYRQLSLVARRFPGRDSYPGDIFHIHSRLLERAGNFRLAQPGVAKTEVAITCLPVVETVLGDISSYIPTNLMSMTDGHIFFDNDYFFKGRRPAINPFLSVTRVGHQTQTRLARELGQHMSNVLSEYERALGFVRFGAELGESTRQVLNLGEKLWQFLNQTTLVSMPGDLQILLCGLVMGGVWDGKNLEKPLKNYGQKELQGVIVQAAKQENVEQLQNFIRANQVSWQKLLA